MALTPNTTRLPNVAPYNTFSLTCTGTSSIEGVGNVALPKGFIWRRRYGSSRFNLVQLTSNATIQIQDGDNLNQPTSSSVLTVTEDIPRDYWYRCRVDLNLTADMIFNRTDIRTITVTGKTHTTSIISVYLPHEVLKVSNLALAGIFSAGFCSTCYCKSRNSHWNTPLSTLMYKSHSCW